MDEPGFPRLDDAQSPAPTTLRVSTLSCIAVSLLALAYPEQPPAGHTGGFDEPTCRRCHFSEAINDPAGTLTLQGLPNDFATDTTYRLTLTVSRPGMANGGFQLAARFATGERAGHQAGALRSVDERVEVKTEGPLRVQYAQHTKAGITLSASDSVSWMVDWTAPNGPVTSVWFHIAANAGNDDASEFGDFVYVAELLSRGEATERE